MPSEQSRAIVDALLNNDNVLTHDQIMAALDDVRDSMFQDMRVEIAQTMLDDEEDIEPEEEDEDYEYSDSESDETEENEF